MKSLITYSVVLMISILLPSHTSKPDINDTQLEAIFKKTFPKIKSVKWFVEGKNKKAILNHDGMVVHLIYSEEAVLLRSIRYYQSDHLPPFILSKIYERFPSADITTVTESYEETAFGYFINIKKGNVFLEMHSDPFGNLSIRKQFRDASGK